MFPLLYELTIEPDLGDTVDAPFCDAQGDSLNSGVRVGYVVKKEWLDDYMEITCRYYDMDLTFKCCYVLVAQGKK